MRAAMYLPGLRPESMSWTIYQEFARSLRAEGLSFELLTDAPPSPPNVQGTTFLPLAAQASWPDRLAAPLTRNPRLIATARLLAQYLRSHPKLDLLYCEIAYPWATAASLARRMARWRGRLVATPMGEDILVVPEAGYGARRHFLPRRALAWTLRTADAIRCISPMVRERVQAWSDCPAAVIPLNVAPTTIAALGRPPDQREAERQAARTALRQRLGLTSSGLVLSLGRMHPFKGLHFLVRAIASMPDAELIIAGPSLSVAGFGDYGTFLRELATSLGLGDRVHFLGRVPHERVLQLLAAADVLVVPSILESMNRVCVEAAAAGTPFVVTETTGIAGYLREPGVGLTVPPSDAEALGVKIKEVLTGRWSCQATAVSRFVAGFDANVIAPRLIELFEAALGAANG